MFSNIHLMLFSAEYRMFVFGGGGVSTHNFFFNATKYTVLSLSLSLGPTGVTLVEEERANWHL